MRLRTTVVACPQIVPSQVSIILYSCVLCALAFLLAIPVGKAETSAPDTRLHVLCPPKENKVATVCRKNLEIHYLDRYDSLKQLLDNIEKHKDQTREWAQADSLWLPEDAVQISNRLHRIGTSENDPH